MLFRTDINRSSRFRRYIHTPFAISPGIGGHHSEWTTCKPL